ncbi:hypothetical protein NEPAR04_1246 [Nematocida parisii]|nr:hypothetical protein NEPAR08_1308 [Nematocida parisii]KAI5128565.1 hypothetical protein NEPAR03_1372 [Nematocida parisii]KAI5141863.1 hypothetical protein NEPAR04_1246 [Nematocida parisii]
MVSNKDKKIILITVVLGAGAAAVIAYIYYLLEKEDTINNTVMASVKDIKYDPHIYIDDLLLLSKSERESKIEKVFGSIESRGFWCFVKELGSSVQERKVLIDDIIDNKEMCARFEKKFGHGVFLKLQKMIENYAPKMYKNEDETKKDFFDEGAPCLTVGDSLVRLKNYYDDDKKIINEQIILSNRGKNSCFLNTAIHSLLSIREIRADLNNITQDFITNVESIAAGKRDVCERLKTELSLDRNFLLRDLFDVVIRLNKIARAFDAADVGKISEEVDKILYNEKMAIYSIINLEQQYCVYNPHTKIRNYNISDSITSYITLYNIMCFFYQFCPLFNGQVEILGKKIVQQQEFITCTINQDSSAAQETAPYPSYKSNLMVLTEYDPTEYSKIHYVDCRDHKYIPVYIPKEKCFSSIECIKRHISRLYSIDSAELHLFLHNETSKKWSFTLLSNYSMEKLFNDATSTAVFYYIPGATDMSKNYNLMFLEFSSSNKGSSRSRNKQLQLPLFVDELIYSAVIESGYQCKESNPKFVGALDQMNDVVPYTYTAPHGVLQPYYTSFCIVKDTSTAPASIDCGIISSSLTSTAGPSSIISFSVKKTKISECYSVGFGNIGPNNSDNVAKQYLLSDSYNCSARAAAVLMSSQGHYITYIASNSSNQNPDKIYICDDDMRLRYVGSYSVDMKMPINSLCDYIQMHPNRKKEQSSMGFIGWCLQILLS